MTSACHVCAAVLVHVARSRRSEPLLDERSFKLRSSMTSSNRPLRATVGQNSSSVQMAAANHVGAAILVHVGRSGRLDDVIDERSFNLVSIRSKRQLGFEHLF